MTDKPKLDLFISVVALLQNHADAIEGFVRDAYRMLDEHFTNYEILLIDNGSRDESQRTVVALLSVYKCVRYLRLSRPLESEKALTAGLDAAIGDYVVT